MNLPLLLFILTASLWLSMTTASSQGNADLSRDLLAQSPPQDAQFPAISVNTEPALGLVFLLMPPSALFFGWHTYDIGEESRANPKFLLPYFTATSDSEILALQRRFQDKRKVWYGATAGGAVLMLVSFTQAIGQAVGGSVNQPVNDVALVGVALLVAGQVARIVSFMSLRKSINLYNSNYAHKRAVATLNMGLLTSRPGNIGIVLKF